MTHLPIALISPKGPLSRHGGGIFKRSLRDMPLTLPTLAALIPEELDARVVCIDEGIADVEVDLDADLVAMTVITGNARGAYELAAAFRRRGMAADPIPPWCRRMPSRRGSSPQSFTWSTARGRRRRPSTSSTAA